MSGVITCARPGCGQTREYHTARVPLYCGPRCKMMVIDARKNKAHSGKHCACGAPISRRSRSCNPCQTATLKGRPRPPVVSTRTLVCARSGCGAAFTPRGRQIYCCRSCKWKVHDARYLRMGKAFYLELVAAGLTLADVTLPRRQAAPKPPRMPSVVVRHDCIHCEAQATCGREGSRQAVLIGAVLYRWRCGSCRRYHQRYGDGRVHQPWTFTMVKRRLGSPIVPSRRVG